MMSACFGRERGHRVIGYLRPSGEALVHREDHAADFSRTEVLGQLLRARPRAGFAEVLPSRLIGRIARIRFDVDMCIDGDEVFRVQPLLIFHSRKKLL